jgi:hypothetical protein
MLKHNASAMIVSFLFIVLSSIGSLLFTYLYLHYTTYLKVCKEAKINQVPAFHHPLGQFARGNPDLM